MTPPPPSGARYETIILGRFCRCLGKVRTPCVFYTEIVGSEEKRIESDTVVSIFEVVQGNKVQTRWVSEEGNYANHNGS
jgi:hypothetical protein